MDWLFSEVQVWHLLLVVVVMVVGWIAEDGALNKLRNVVLDHKHGNYVKIDHHVENMITLDKRIDKAFELMDAQADAHNENFDTIFDDIDALQVPWWKRKVAEWIGLK